MRQINQHTFENGLQVIHIQKANFSKSFASVLVKYGAKDVYLEEKFPLGIAHFLEHKMFELPQGDYLNLFADLGASANAFTSMQETVYYFSTSNELTKPLNLLLDLVSTLEISEESTKKEQGIIIEELNMYNSDPEVQIFQNLIENLYATAPIRYDILGDKEAILATNKKALERCFELFYNPSNLMITVVTPESFEQVLQQIKQHSLSQKKAIIKPQTLYLEEPTNVVKADDTIYLDVETDKIYHAYKLAIISDFTIRKKRELALRLLLNFVLTPLNDQYQIWLDERKINDYFYAYIDMSDTHSMLCIRNEGNDHQFMETLYQLLLTSEINESQLTKIKKRFYATSVRIFDTFYELGLYATRCIRHQQVVGYDLEIIKNLSLQDIKEAQKYVSDQSFTKLQIKKKL